MLGARKIKSPSCSQLAGLWDLRRRCGCRYEIYFRRRVGWFAEEGAPSLRRKLARRRPFDQCFRLLSPLRRPRTSASTTPVYLSSFALITYCLLNLLAWHSASSPAHSNHLFEPQACLRSPPASGANQSDIFGGHRTKSPQYSGLVSSALWGPSHCLDYRLYDDTWAMRTRV